MNSVDRMIARESSRAACEQKRNQRWVRTKQLVDSGKIEPYYGMALTTRDGKPAGMINREQRFRPLRIIEQICREVLLTAIGQHRDDRAIAHPFGHLGRCEDCGAGADSHKQPFILA
jgi:hypothetical protein